MDKQRTAFADLPDATQAGMLCNEAAFRVFVDLQTFNTGTQVTTTAAAEFIRSQCGIKSRRELVGNPDAARKFQTLRTEYDAWRGAIPPTPTLGGDHESSETPPLQNRHPPMA